MRQVVLGVLVLAGVAWADAEPRFAKLRDQAEALESLSSFVEKYAGSCGPALLGGGDCAKNADVFRRGATNKKFYMIVTEDTASVLSMGELNPKTGNVYLNLTPFFGAGGSAVTHGAPGKADANGNPVLPYVRIEASMPDGWNSAMMARQVAARAMRLQIVFTPLGLWQLPKKGGGAVRGVKARFDAVLVSVGRTGEPVGVWYAKD
jgi:hypothetical protein